MLTNVEKKGLFSYPIVVEKKHIDVLNHVNNEVYLSWLLEAATAHSDTVGFEFEKYLKLGNVFVVRRHELDYLLPTYLGEELVVETWVESTEGARCNRRYEIVRVRDRRVIMEAKTLWVFINIKTGRPTQILGEIIAQFLPTSW